MWKVWISSFTGPRAQMLCVHTTGAEVKLKLHLLAGKRTLGSERKDISGSLLRLTSTIRCLHLHGLGHKTLFL